MTKKHILTIEIDAKLANDLRKYCFEKNLTKVTVVRQLLRELLSHKATITITNNILN